MSIIAAKRYCFLVLLLVVVAFSSCSDDNSPLQDSMTDKFAVSVTNGYGGGVYGEGDTVYVYSRSLGELEVFEAWEISHPNLEFIEDAREWKFSFIMPNADVFLEAKIANLPNGFLQYNTLELSNSTKPIYFSFPENPVGTVFVFHGTGGSAAGWVGTENGQQFQLVKDLYHAGFGVIVTESEESTRNTDLDGDGRIRWHPFPIDTVNNIDYRNLNTIIDTFDSRGLVDRNKLFSIGMSAGGSFSGTFSIAFNMVASAIYCASSQPAIMENTNAAIQFCMMDRDEVIGELGNTNALGNSSLLSLSGCANYFESFSFPIYPEFFQWTGISANESLSVFEELKSNGLLDATNVPASNGREVTMFVHDKPQAFPVLNSLSNAQKAEVRNLVNLAFSGHQFYAHHNKQTIDFFKSLCL